MTQTNYVAGRPECPTDTTKDRVYELVYSGANLDIVKDPYGTVIADYGHDPAGRVTSVLSPVPGGTTTTSLGYDDNGNMSSVTPPGQPAHTMNYTPADQMSLYDPPVVPDVTTDVTSYAYTLDGRPDLATLPYSVAPAPTLDWEYDPQWGRLSALFASNGPIGYDLDYIYEPAGASRGKLTEIFGPSAGVKLTFVYAGRLHTETWWDGLAATAKKVQVTYDDNFRPNGEKINDASLIVYDYDDDGLLTIAGDLTLTRDTFHGLVS